MFWNRIPACIWQSIYRFTIGRSWVCIVKNTCYEMKQSESTKNLQRFRDFVFLKLWHSTNVFNFVQRMKKPCSALTLIKNTLFRQPTEKKSNKYFDKIHFDLKLISLMHNGGTLLTWNWINYQNFKRWTVASTCKLLYMYIIINF